MANQLPLNHICAGINSDTGSRRWNERSLIIHANRVGHCHHRFAMIIFIVMIIDWDKCAHPSIHSPKVYDRVLLIFGGSVAPHCSCNNTWEPAGHSLSPPILWRERLRDLGQPLKWLVFAGVAAAATFPNPGYSRICLNFWWSCPINKHNSNCRTHCKQIMKWFSGNCCCFCCCCCHCRWPWKIPQHYEKKKNLFYEDKTINNHQQPPPTKTKKGKRKKNILWSGKSSNGIDGREDSPQ